MRCLAFALALIAMISCTSSPSQACSPDESWWDVSGEDDAPANEILFFRGFTPNDLVALVDNEAVTMVPVDFGVERKEILLDPMPRLGDTVTFLGDCDDRNHCDEESFVVGPDDVTPPSLDSFHFDIHDHPFTFSAHEGTTCDEGGSSFDVTYYLHLEGLRHEHRDYAFLEWRAPSDGPILLRYAMSLDDERVTGELIKLEVAEVWFQGFAPEDICVSVELSDRAGNALTPVTSCAPCRLVKTETGEEAVWSEDTFYPGGVCETESPTPQRLPRLPELEGEVAVSGCSVASRDAEASWWLIVAALGLWRCRQRAHR